MAEEGENEDGTVGEDDVKTTDDLDKRGSRGVEDVRLMKEAQERAGRGEAERIETPVLWSLL